MCVSFLRATVEEDNAKARVELDKDAFELCGVDEMGRLGVGSKSDCCGSCRAG